MSKYRKKPVVIDAEELTSKSIKKVYEFIHGKLSDFTFIESQKFEDYEQLVCENGMQIQTLEGTMTAQLGDFVIKGVKGEFYPCKPDIFASTYEKIDDELQS